MEIYWLTDWLNRDTSRNSNESSFCSHKVRKAIIFQKQTHKIRSFLAIFHHYLWMMTLVSLFGKHWTFELRKRVMDIFFAYCMTTLGLPMSRTHQIRLDKAFTGAYFLIIYRNSFCFTFVFVYCFPSSRLELYIEKFVYH